MGDDDKKQDDKKVDDKKVDLAAQNAELVKKLADLDAKIAKYESDNKKDDEDLSDKAKRQRESDNNRQNESKALEGAITFNLKAKDFLKTNESLLSKDIADLFTQADKENYGSAVEKAAAIKSGIVQSFFSIQANVDLLTPGLKSSLDDYLKLTKTGKQEKAQAVYDGIFEPAFEMLKRVKKAEALNKGYGSDGDAETAYKNKLIAGSKKHYLGETAK